MERPVLKNPNPVLRQVAKPLEKTAWKTEEIKTLIRDMRDSMRVENGVGLAAPQIGASVRLILVDRGGEVVALLNPELSNLSFAKVNSEEACLSVPGLYGTVKRHRSLTLRAIMEDGTEIEERVNGFDAIVLQHEVDHLNGILFIDKAENISQESNGAAI